MSELRISGLCKSFDGHPILREIDLAVERGTLLALLGPSGSGKTTLLRVLCGFERADDGTVEIDGKRVAGANLHLPPERRRIGYVPQEGALFPHLSVADNIVFGLPRGERRAHRRVAELLAWVGLPAHYANRAPQQLSGGQQQRVALARALAPSPTLVLLDEPFSSLDAALRIETRESVMQALAAAGTTAVLVTHDQSEALSLGDQVAVMWQGRLVQTAVPQMLYREPANRDIACFVGDAVFLAAVASDGIATTALGSLTLRTPVTDGPVEVMVRPEQFQLLKAGEPAGRGFEAIVRDVTFNGQYADVGVDLLACRTPHATCTVRLRVPGHRMPSLSDHVRIMVDGDVVAYGLPTKPRVDQARGPG